jgi:hypothetical protein
MVDEIDSGPAAPSGGQGERRGGRPERGPGGRTGFRAPVLPVLRGQDRGH